MENKKYEAQIKHLRNNYKRFRIDFKNEVFESFSEICKEKGTTPTTEIKKFVDLYIQENNK